jgi:hypothetical protein
MRTVFPLKEPRRTAAVGILLIVAVLVVGTAACDDAANDNRTYQLAVSSASGGSVATPGTGTFAYEAGIVVQLVATPDEGYEFRSWTGDTGGVANPKATSTTITMNGNYAIAANFQIEGESDPDEEPSHQQ